MIRLYVCACCLNCMIYFYFFFFFNDTATTEIYTLSLHDALPISAATPREIVERLHASLSRILADPGMPKRFEILGAEIVAGTPQALAKLVRDDQAKWSKVIREKNITVE